MAVRISHLFRNRFKQFFKTYSTNSAEISKAKDPEVTEQVKERLLDRWAKYWKNLFIDYRDVAKDVAQGCKDRPIRASIYFSLLGSVYYFSRHNPSPDSYRNMLIEESNKMMMVGEPIRNRQSVRHLKSIEQCFNEGIIRRLSLGIVSFIWLDNYDKECAYYKATCSYLKPQYLGFHHRIVDIGFMDKWWLLEDKMTDFDINEEEFKDFSTSPDKIGS
ncbi:mitochondrial import inner membrane translocase subunit Tim29 [Neodiprion pinetum]|uniref:mitochondrial import inner membrane translocase subunit Tim29 n=1 Tax=Neodiprion pinetum TaxID=441929 RepID=UPI001EDD7730|nr:mitochondrial import inner membrane translocase subunit Tim29 [Neodiprion pinetum]